MSSSDQTEAVVGHEQRDIRPGSVVGWGVGVFLLMVLALGAAWAFLAGVNSHLARTGPPANPMMEHAPKEPPAPRLQADPLTDLEALHARERAQLDGYAWVDRQTGTVRIPIERAMTLLAERRDGESP
jgi:hypothetical protein